MDDCADIGRSKYSGSDDAPLDQSGRWKSESFMESMGAGVFGGENGRVSKHEGASRPLVVNEMPSVSSISESSLALGISIVGIGISAALTEARKVSVGPS